MLRTIDANLNRAREGMRVLEDIARFTLNDAALSKQFKDLRHQISAATATLGLHLLSDRDSSHDVGAEARPAEDLGRPDLIALSTANARRVEESLRVLEETTRLPGLPEFDWRTFQRARFALYDLEKRLVSSLKRSEGRSRIRGLYLVLDTAALNGRKETDVARQAIRGGVTMLQLRDKGRRGKELLASSRELQHMCREEGVLFVVNDYVDVAMAMDAECVHLGQEDLPLDAARRLIPQGMLLGGTTRTVERAIEVEAQGADYVAVGSMYPTKSKHDTRVVGPEMLAKVRAKVSLPLVAIGGINKDNVAAVTAAGADAIAVISAIMSAGDIESAARELVRAIEESRDQRRT
ncbi:MAG: thiamine phosphate synthase [Chloroflexi bacterium]|nr:thiamine phosphate synthase [Chloroflexota bacterium]